MNKLVIGAAIMIAVFMGLFVIAITLGGRL